jgi:hypothetical protein
MWNPPLLDEELGTRGSALYEAAELFSELVSSGARTICFMKSRKGIELILRHSLDRLDPEIGERIAPYRGGYTPQQRQEIQRRLMAGELLGFVATDALALGIDIGEFDAAICVTFPGTVASLRCGARGRRGRGLAVYIAGEDALDHLPAPDEFWIGLSRRRSRPREPRDLRRAPAVRRPRGAAQRRGRADPRAAMAVLCRGADPGRVPARARHRLSPGAPMTIRPRASRCARPRPTAFC